MIDAALLAMIVENRGGQLTARVTVDAAGVDKEISRHVFRQTPLDVRHTRALSPTNVGSTQLLGVRRLDGALVFGGLTPKIYGEPL